MAILKPFAALLPKPELASQICELPYDVMSSEEAREMARGNPLSFLHVSKPEIDLPPGVDLYSPEVYAKGLENFQALMAKGALAKDSAPHFYLYRQVMGGHSQVGLVAAASCVEYQKNIIKKHEFTRPDKEDDRVRHIETLNAQTGPVFLTYRASETFDAFVARKILEKPVVDLTAKDGVRHTAWTISSPDEIKMIERQFASIPFLYIADGHHRSAAASRVFNQRQGAGESGRFLAVIFPHNQMQILPYNRVLKDLNGHQPQQLLDLLQTSFDFKSNAGSPRPNRKHEVSLYLAGKWYSLVFKKELTEAPDPVDQLDVSLLQDHVLAPIFGIDDPRTSKKINFVGGIRGTAELERLVNSGEYACAFSMFPTSIEDLMTIADGGGIMPPKSTWFEPKLRDAMFSHMI
jgi:uncharacterized protein (DUF1015 family)